MVDRDLKTNKALVAACRGAKPRSLRRRAPPMSQRLRIVWRGICAASFALLTVSCASLDTMSAGSASGSSVSSAGVATSTAGLRDVADSATPEEVAEPEKSTRMIPGDDSGNIVLPPVREPLTLYGDAVSINFEEAPLADVVHSILGDTLGLDYIVEHPIQGNVTVRTRSPVPRDQLLPIIESLLLNNGALLVRGPGDRFFISRAGAGNTMVPRFDNPNSQTLGYASIIVPLEHISAVEMAEILGPVAPERAFVRVDQSRNLLILAGTQLQLSGWLDIVATFDVDQLAGTSVGVFPIVQGEVEDVFKELSHILQTADGKASGGIGAMVNVLPVERLNSILVVSPRAEYVDKVGGWINELDSIEESASESTLHVYEVINGNADNLASLLGALYTGNAGNRGGNQPSSQVAPGMQSQTNRSAGAGDMPGTGGPVGGGANFMLDDSVRVVSDRYNNSLLVYASSYEYAKVKKILERLDVVATQVLIEASIVEVTLTDDLQYGLEWTFQNGIGNNYSGSGALNLTGLLGAAGGDGGALAQGFSYTVTNKAGAVRAIVNALAEKSLVNVISTPSVMVLDNHTAAIHVGDQQPIQSRQTVTDGGNFQTSIEYKDTGVKLEVTPSVNDGGLVTLNVVQSVTDVGPVDSATNQRSFLERNVSSKVAIRDGESVVLGGLIRDNATSGKSGVPLLMDIPVVGNLFSTTTDVTARTELLIFITPRVLESDQDLGDITDEMRQRMRGLKNFDDLPSGLQATD
jgi:general secretion pathway protein D